MSIVKELFIDAYDELVAEAEEAGLPIDEDKLADKAMSISNDRFRDMVDAARERAKYDH